MLVFAVAGLLSGVGLFLGAHSWLPPGPVSVLARSAAGSGQAARQGMAVRSRSEPVHPHPPAPFELRSGDAERSPAAAGGAVAPPASGSGPLAPSDADEDVAAAAAPGRGAKARPPESATTPAAPGGATGVPAVPAPAHPLGFGIPVALRAGLAVLAGPAPPRAPAPFGGVAAASTGADPRAIAPLPPPPLLLGPPSPRSRASASADLVSVLLPAGGAVLTCLAIGLLGARTLARRR